MSKHMNFDAAIFNLDGTLLNSMDIWEQQLKDLHTKLAVTTGLPYELFKPCLINNSVWDLFDAVCSSDEVNRGKEYTDVFELAAQKLGVPLQRCIVFDDVLPAYARVITPGTRL